ncbi:hypothetical protein BSG18_09780 [Pseudomonas ogarae]|uniref:hypothetical protein n=1 Tax=Pseudomonas ogarae (strain DSM 112162 / CECT 30235 / F113) TaxID=1114970 RepID=UPI000BB36E10|nr:MULTISPECIES: hypothetical protein [Pseudomonas]PBJ25542.1 hypothetical protein BSG18_09780 [Pseudomonas ogarae]QXH95712.1 hypothetical protein HU749_004780 [Pseudomonas zarinae]
MPIQLNPIDIAEWRRHREFSEAYPEGARPKRLVVSPYDPIQDVIRPDWQYMFKLSDEKYPEQYWAELIAYQIGLLLNIDVPPAHAAFDSMTGECGSLSEWFYTPDEEVFFAAGYFFYREIKNFDKDRGTQHNLLTAQKLSIDFIGDNQIFDFWSMLMFDAVIGNTDRHQDNWGYLITSSPNTKSVARRKGEQYGLRLKFAPWFDNGTSLGYQILERKFSQWDAFRLDNFIRKGTHHIRWAPDNLVQVGHLESMDFISKHNPKVRALILRKLKQFDTAHFINFMEQLVDLPMPPHARLTKARANFVIRLTLRRIELITEKLNAHH